MVSFLHVTRPPFPWSCTPTVQVNENVHQSLANLAYGTAPWRSLWLMAGETKNQAKHVTSSQNIPSRPHHNRLMMQKLLSTITATPSFTFTRPYRQATSKQHHNVSNPCPLPSSILCPALHPCLPASSPPRQPPANSRRDPPGPPALVLLPIAWPCLVFGLFGAGCMDTLTSQPQLWHASA